jgi:hypothetical protein
MFYLKLAAPFSGLTNQLFSLVNSVILALSTGDKVVCIDHFSTDFRKTNHHANIAEILNIKKINNFLHSKYGVIIIDKNESCNLKMNYIAYGSDCRYRIVNNPIDIVSQNNTTNNNDNNSYNYPVYIQKETDLNSVFGDPCFNTPKRFKLNYTVNDYAIEETYSEKLNKNVVVDIQNAEYVNMSSFWINSYNRNMFEDILQNIEFNDHFIDQSKDIVKKYGNCIKINVIHLRVEDDAIEHWSKINKLSETDFKNFIESKYISLIKRYIAITDFTIILTGSNQNGVFNFLKQQNYKFATVEKRYEDRELNAIIELLVSSACNSTFIGNFNFDALNGSTFSYLISQRLSKTRRSVNANTTPIRQIMINLDRIFEPEKIL